MGGPCSVGYRRYHEWLVSSYNQTHKNKKEIEPFTDCYRNPHQQNDSYRVFSEMIETFFHVSVINFDSPDDLMADVYCNIIPNAPHACAWYTNQLLTNALEKQHANPSVPLWPKVIAAEASRKGLPSVKEKNIIKFATEINYALPLKCISGDEQKQILEKSLKDEKEMLPEFFASPLGKKELRKGFAKAMEEHKFCSVDAATVLNDKTWQSFFEGARFE